MGVNTHINILNDFMKSLIFCILSLFLLCMYSCHPSRIANVYSYYLPIIEEPDDSNIDEKYPDLDFPNNFFVVYRETVCDSSSMKFSHLEKELDSVRLSRPQACVKDLLNMFEALDLNLSNGVTDTVLILDYTSMYNPSYTTTYTIFHNKIYKSKLTINGLGIREIYSLPEVEFVVDSINNSSIANLFMNHPNTLFYNYLYTWNIGSIEDFFKYLTPKHTQITAERVVFSKTKIEDFQVLYITDAVTRDLEKSNEYNPLEERQDLPYL